MIAAEILKVWLVDRWTTLMGSQQCSFLSVSFCLRAVMWASSWEQADAILKNILPSILDVVSAVSSAAVFVKSDASLLLPGPPVNVTCNIFINSFGSITETTMVRFFCSGFLPVFPWLGAHAQGSLVNYWQTILTNKYKFNLVIPK